MRSIREDFASCEEQSHLSNSQRPLFVNSQVPEQGARVGLHLPAGIVSLALRGLIAICCAAGGSYFWSESAQASCGDYVVPRGAHLAKDTDATAVHPGTAMLPGTAAHSALALPPAPPCNSPTCRGDVPNLPVPSAPLNVNLSEKPLALFAGELPGESGGLGRDWPRENEHAQPGYRSRLERPPSL